MSKRKSFIVHIDSLDVLDDLTDQQAGMLFKAIKAHQSNEEITLDAITKIAFSPIKNQFIRDDERYQDTCKRRADAGSKGGKQKVANATKSNQDQANLADNKNKNKNKSKNDSDSDSESESKSKSKKHLSSGRPDYTDEEKSVIDHLNEKAGKNFKPVAANMKFIQARLAEGHTIDDLKSVIDLMAAKWGGDEKFNQFLRPATLFNAEKFNQYIGEVGAVPPDQVDGKYDDFLNGTAHDPFAPRREEKTIDGEVIHEQH